MEFIFILLLAFGAMWLMTSRTRKQQKAAASFRDNLAPGQEVMTGSGMFGTIVAIDDEAVTLETSPGVTSRWLRPAIAKLVEPPVADEDEDDEYEDEDGEYDDEYDDEEYEDDDELVEDDDELETAGVDGDVAVPDDASSLTGEAGEPGDTDKDVPPRT
ncbi:preprotein translocase subunit YajC [Actinotalea sp. K2]|uniref:preprotein translocase subunit YajC n=1 Tax=Actinotalea sp. K2 TaxID=2939438 RepID=UPI002016F387|nr:preprotein translocase subunit YajC [Actinotalea sp. K2]MCL3862317.1 preprotein translocase subunit YajC [Actinotalea sp. K2]